MQTTQFVRNLKTHNVYARCLSSLVNVRESKNEYCAFIWHIIIYSNVCGFVQTNDKFANFQHLSKQQHSKNRKMYHISNVNNGTQKPLLTISNEIFLDFDIWPNIVCILLQFNVLFLSIPLNWY